MEFIYKVFSLIFTLSFFTFAALFGRLPILRNGPIGFLYRTIWVYIPRACQKADERFLGGRLRPLLVYGGNYIMNEKHPLVLAFYVGTILIAEAIYVPSAWPRLSFFHKSTTVVIISSVYLLIFIAATTPPGYITRRNHAKALQTFQYDRILFYPGKSCSTCNFSKPARSKHCRICKTCVARMDHHCAWINNCVGQNNLRAFFFMLIGTSLLLTYGSWLGYTLLSRTLQEHAWNTAEAWSKGLGWIEFFQAWGWVIKFNSRIGAVLLLAAATAPMGWGLVVYHTYLIWSGMTTNEHQKWRALQEAIYDGEIFVASWDDLHQKTASGERQGSKSELERPPGGLMIAESFDPADTVIYREGWRRLDSLRELTNVYDRGFAGNLLDVLRPEKMDR